MEERSSPTRDALALPTLAGTALAPALPPCPGRPLSPCSAQGCPAVLTLQGQAQLWRAEARRSATQGKPSLFPTLLLNYELIFSSTSWALLAASARSLSGWLEPGDHAVPQSGWLLRECPVGAR